MEPLLITIIVLALVFDYINGFHDAANSIATVVSTNWLRFTRSSVGDCGTGVSTVSSSVTGPPVGGVPRTMAVFLVLPASTSPCVTR